MTQILLNLNTTVMLHFIRHQNSVTLLILHLPIKKMKRGYTESSEVPFPTKKLKSTSSDLNLCHLRSDELSHVVEYLQVGEVIMLSLLNRSMYQWSFSSRFSSGETVSHSSEVRTRER